MSSAVFERKPVAQNLPRVAAEGELLLVEIHVAHIGDAGLREGDRLGHPPQIDIVEDFLVHNPDGQGRFVEGRGDLGPGDHIADAVAGVIDRGDLERAEHEGLTPLFSGYLLRDPKASDSRFLRWSQTDRAPVDPPRCTAGAGDGIFSVQIASVTTYPLLAEEEIYDGHSPPTTGRGPARRDASSGLDTQGNCARGGRLE